MKLPGTDNRVWLNMLVALVMSLILNFSHFVFYLTVPAAEVQKRMHIHSVNPNLFLALQVGYFFVLMLLLLYVTTGRFSWNGDRPLSFTQKLIVSIALTFILYFVTPNTNRAGDLLLTFMSKRLFSPVLTLKCSFSLVVALLYGKIYELIYQKQAIAIENEQLRSENLQSRYNMLVSQINPHFLFNSLNSLSMLIREEQKNKALEYIDELSDTFRYIIQNGQHGLTSLREELKFLDAYRYLLEMRYADKLFFRIEIDPRLVDFQLPSLSLQPLIENAVKHNTITSQRPLTINIFTTADGELVVSNRIYPKLASEEGTGIGLDNLSSRYKLLTSNDIHIENNGLEFIVTLPLVNPHQ